MKAQQEILTPLLITGIMISIIGSVYVWGVPLIQKNQDLATLQKAEDFMKNLDLKIKNVANSGGRDSITIESGVLKFNPAPFDSSSKLNTGSISLKLITKGTIYSSGVYIPFVRDDICHFDGNCIIGNDEPEWFYVESNDIDGSYLTNYTLTYRNMNSPDLSRSYLINLTGTFREAGSGHEIIIEYKGTSIGTPTLSNIDIRII